MQSNQSSSPQTGTRNETYDVIAVLYHALQGAENCQTYLRDAQNEQSRSLFEQALNAQRQLAELAKQALQQVLQDEQGGAGSAFGFGSQGQSQGQTSAFETTSPNTQSSVGDPVETGGRF